MKNIRQCKSIILAIICGILLPAWSVQAAPKTFKGKVNINTATATELTQIPGIGAAKAAAIVKERQLAQFGKVNELLRIRGIGPKLLARITPYIVVSNANMMTAQRHQGVKRTSKK